ncbi:hypothetical protein BS47DRAFT_1399858 [Hydnum rufescens UP504]|uniref:Uncharacterized protein n=1 Tax=Hydnum rufescens UP504 TaxID=1448309 RepID=A0A9P6DLM9_9AGAM|nr:hypothetical protein BS47DRAFT_1399858 [Hydnum rufescens UP504]
MPPYSVTRSVRATTIHRMIDPPGTAKLGLAEKAVPPKHPVAVASIPVDRRNKYPPRSCHPGIEWSSRGMQPPSRRESLQRNGLQPLDCINHREVTNGNISSAGETGTEEKFEPENGFGDDKMVLGLSLKSPRGMKGIHIEEVSDPCVYEGTIRAHWIAWGSLSRDPWGLTVSPGAGKLLVLYDWFMVMAQIPSRTRMALGYDDAGSLYRNKYNSVPRVMLTVCPETRLPSVQERNGPGKTTNPDSSSMFPAMTLRES